MTTIQLTDAAIGTGLAADLPALTLTIDAGEVTVIPVETDERPMVLSLLLGGRLALTAGGITPPVGELRTRVALVDTPFASEPSPGVALSVVVAEELSFARRASGRRAVRAFLESHGLEQYASVPMRSLPSTARVLLLCELAAQRPGVDVLVVTSPERHGGDPLEWYSTLVAMTKRGLAVAIVTDTATSRLLKAAS
ncbi:hypothetical protein [Pseudolysinimonas sp.]|uniref:hypothetical protein n=1 Tax=Pseudolysinimonas sp. TaxID=2680009 RepID=UPI00378336AF